MIEGIVDRAWSCFQRITGEKTTEPTGDGKWHHQRQQQFVATGGGRFPASIPPLFFSTDPQNGIQKPYHVTGNNSFGGGGASSRRGSSFVHTATTVSSFSSDGRSNIHHNKMNNNQNNSCFKKEQQQHPSTVQRSGMSSASPTTTRNNGGGEQLPIPVQQQQQMDDDLHFLEQAFQQLLVSEFVWICCCSFELMNEEQTRCVFCASGNIVYIVCYFFHRTNSIWVRTNNNSSWRNRTRKNGWWSKAEG